MITKNYISHLNHTTQPRRDVTSSTSCTGTVRHTAESNSWTSYLTALRTAESNSWTSKTAESNSWTSNSNTKNLKNRDLVIHLLSHISQNVLEQVDDQINKNKKELKDTDKQLKSHPKNVKAGEKARDEAEGRRDDWDRMIEQFVFLKLYTSGQPAVESDAMEIEESPEDSPPDESPEDYQDESPDDDDY